MKTLKLISIWPNKRVSGLTAQPYISKIVTLSACLLNPTTLILYTSVSDREREREAREREGEVNP